MRLTKNKSTNFDRFLSIFSPNDTMIERDLQNFSRYVISQSRKTKELTLIMFKRKQFLQKTLILAIGKSMNQSTKHQEMRKPCKEQTKFSKAKDMRKCQHQHQYFINHQ